MAKKKETAIFSSEPQNDNYRKVFKEGMDDMIAMSEYLTTWESQSKWYTLSLDQMLTAVESGGPLIINDIKSRYNFIEGTTDDTISSTIANGLELGTIAGSQMLLVTSEVDAYRTTAICLADTGLQSLIMRAGVDCSAIWKSSILDKKTIIDLGLKVAKDKKVLALYSFGKIRAFNGGTTYCILKQSEMFDAIIKMLSQDYKSFKFNGGSFTHTRTYADFELSGDTEDILETYHKMCEEVGSTKSKDLKVQFEFSTSEVGEECATIGVLLTRGLMRILIGSPIKIPHNNGMTTEKFIEALPQLLAKTKDMVSGLENLLNIEVKNPVNAVISLAKAVGLAKVQTLAAAGDFQKTVDDRKKDDENAVITAHDVFYVLQETLMEMRKAKVSESTILKCEENLARTLVPEFNWSDFDVELRPEWNK